MSTEARVETSLQAAYALVSSAGAEGMNWVELADNMCTHHGVASWALSRLHRKGDILRLSETRNRSKVYVLPEWVGGRKTERVGRRSKLCQHCGQVA